MLSTYIFSGLETVGIFAAVIAIAVVIMGYAVNLHDPRAVKECRPILRPIVKRRVRRAHLKERRLQRVEAGRRIRSNLEQSRRPR